MTENKSAVVRPEGDGAIHIAEDVIASIAAIAATEVEGVGSLTTGAGVGWTEMLGKKNIARGVKLAIDGSVVAVEVCILVKYGFGVSAVAQKVQEGIRLALTNMAGLETSAVNVHVCGIAFDKERKKQEKA